MYKQGWTDTPASTGCNPYSWNTTCQDFLFTTKHCKITRKWNKNKSAEIFLHSSHKITINKNTLLQDLTDTAEENFWRSSKTQSPLTVTKSSWNKNGVKLHRTLVNTPGFSDQLNNKQCCQPIAAFLENTPRGHQSICLPLFSLLPVGRDSNILMYRICPTLAN